MILLRYDTTLSLRHREIMLKMTHIVLKHHVRAYKSNWCPEKYSSKYYVIFFESGSKWTVQKGESGRSWAKLDGHLSHSGRFRTIVDGLLGQSGRSWVKVDGHSTKSGRSLGINRSVKVDGPKESNWTVRKCQSERSKSSKVDGL